MKKILFVSVLLAISACSSTPPDAPEPEGEMSVINQTAVTLSFLHAENQGK